MPYSGKRDGEVVMAVALYFELPSRPFMVEYNMWSLLTRCWTANPADRPSIDSIVAELKSFGISPRFPTKVLDRKTNVLDLPPLIADTAEIEVGILHIEQRHEV